MSESPESLASYLLRRMAELDIGSAREFGRRAGVSPETARRLLAGSVTPDERTLRKVAEQLPAPLGRLRELAGRPRGADDPFVLPPEADQLDREQRAVILSMISVLLRSPGQPNATSAISDGPRIAARRRDPNG